MTPCRAELTGDGPGGSRGEVLAVSQCRAESESAQTRGGGGTDAEGESARTRGGGETLRRRRGLRSAGLA